jgi:hypothetical protein
MKDKKIGKAQMILLLYEKLLTERRVANGFSFLADPLPSVTFKRYIYDIRDYLAAFASDYEVVYCRREKIYKLVRKHQLDEKETFLSIGAPQTSVR